MPKIESMRMTEGGHSQPRYYLIKRHTSCTKEAMLSRTGNKCSWTIMANFPLLQAALDKASRDALVHRRDTSPHPSAAAPGLAIPEQVTAHASPLRTAQPLSANRSL